MAQPQELPDRALRRVVELSAFLGFLSGSGEALMGLATPPFYAHDTIYVTLVANVLVFSILGMSFWVLGLGLERELAYFLLLFMLLWALLNNWESEVLPRVERDLLWLVNVIGTCLMALLLSLWARKHEQKVARIVRQALPWVIGSILASFVAIHLYGFEAEHGAMSIAPRAAGGSLPNIVLIVVDTLRADHLSCYHYQRLTSPNLDNLAAQGVLFENAIATSSWTLPSHASMLTGLYPNQHRAQGFRDQLAIDAPTISEELQRVGYRTGAFSGSPFFTPRQGLGRGFIEFGDFSFSPLKQVHYVASIVNELRETGWIGANIGQPSGTNINESVIHWIRKSRQAFFLVVNYFELHDPDSMPQPWRLRFSPGQRSENSILDQSKLAVSQVTLQIQRKIEAYDGAIAYDDDRLQKLVDELGRRGLMDRTLLIVTGDHGEGLGEHGLLDHGTALYYPLIHVPLIFYWPEHLPAGLRIQRPVSTKDIPATILDLLGASHRQLPGESLAAFWNGHAPPGSWPMPMSELVRERLRSDKAYDARGEIESIISSKFQFILDPREGSSLYNWQDDPQESMNLILAPSYEALGKELATELERSR